MKYRNYKRRKHINKCFCIFLTKYWYKPCMKYKHINYYTYMIYGSQNYKRILKPSKFKRQMFSEGFVRTDDAVQDAKFLDCCKIHVSCPPPPPKCFGQILHKISLRILNNFAQLMSRLVCLLIQNGFEFIHTLNLNEKLSIWVKLKRMIREWQCPWFGSSRGK